MTVAELSYPVVALSGATTVAARSYRELTRATRTGMRSGYFKKLTIIDCQGQRIRVAGACPKGLNSPLVLLGWFIGFPVVIDLQGLEALSPLDLDQLKSVLCHQIDRDRMFWESVAVGAAGLKARVRSASSFEDAILLFA